MRAASGGVVSSDPLVAFLYTLMRDHLPVGGVEVLIRDASDKEVETTYTNGWLARIAEDQAARLRGDRSATIQDSGHP